jgi:hypothetical protein
VGLEGLPLGWNASKGSNHKKLKEVHNEACKPCPVFESCSLLRRAIYMSSEDTVKITLEKAQ